MISNLLNNAIKFTREGTVSIIAAVVPKNNEIAVNISDTGAGIDSEILPRLFTKFAAKSIMGTGLGLFISKRFRRTEQEELRASLGVPHIFLANIDRLNEDRSVLLICLIVQVNSKLLS